MVIGEKDFQTENQTYIMGILNVTPDSFSDGGRYNQLDQALFHAEEMIRDGADLIDIGGESTRPGYTKICDQEEIDRILPVIEALKQRFDVPLSIDTYKSQVAKAAIAAGADLINDIWGLQYDSEMASVIAQGEVACCLMHNRKEASYHHYMKEVIEDLQHTLSLAQEAGIAEDKIIIDPGVGFAKSYEQNLEIIAKLAKLKVLDKPILLGTSRKSVIGLTLDLPATQRVEGTLVTTVLAALEDVMFVRVHDVKENARAIKMTKAILAYKN